MRQATSRPQATKPLTTYSTQSQAFFNRLATAPTTARKSAYDTMITGLVNAGVWSKLDGLYLLAAADAATARTNLVSSSYGLTSVGTPTFAADAGYTGNNTTSQYLETGFDPTAGSPLFTQNSASVFAWKNNNVTGDRGFFLGMSNDSSYVDPDLADGRFYYYVNSAGGNTASLASTTGLYLGTRSSSTQTNSYLKGAPINSNSVANSVAPAAGKTMRFLSDGGPGNVSDSQVSAGGFGSSFTDADSRNLSAYVTNYMTAIAGGTTSPQYLLSSDIANDGANNISPDVKRLADDRLIAVYNLCTPSQTLCDIDYRTSSDNGVTWSSAGVVATHATGHTLVMGGLVVLSSGTLIVELYDSSDGGVTAFPYVIRGTVSGGVITWGAEIAISTGFTGGKAIPFGALKLANGQLMQSLYDNSGLNINVVFSSDSGLTWGGEKIVVSGNLGYNEASYVQLASGTIVGVLRRDGASKGYYLTTSTDNGATWSAPTLIFGAGVADAPGGHSLTLTPAGKIFMVGRFTGPAGSNQTGYTYSSDNGATWSTPTIYYNIGAYSYGSYIYGGGFYDSTTKSLMYAVAQGSFSAAEMIFQQFSLPQ